MIRGPSRTLDVLLGGVHGRPAKAIDFICGQRCLFFLFHTNFHGRRQIKMAETRGMECGGAGGAGGPAGEEKRLRGGKNRGAGMCLGTVPAPSSAVPNVPCCPAVSCLHPWSSPTSPWGPEVGHPHPRPRAGQGDEGEPPNPAAFWGCGGSRPCAVAACSIPASRNAQAEKNTR